MTGSTLLSRDCQQDTLESGLELRMRQVLPAIIGFLAFATIGTAVLAADIVGAGATFPAPIYEKWSEAYRAATGAGVDYRPVGSAGGIKQIAAKSVTFGATDKPLSDAELAEAGLIQFPMIMGGVVPIFNLPGLAAGALTLDGQTLAAIFTGEITRWDDPRLKALNPGIDLPAEEISVIHRSDGSGTTYCFTTYLSAVSPTWRERIGSGAAVEWPVGSGAKRNDGVADEVANSEGAIGYVEFSAADTRRLSYAAMLNRGGARVEPGFPSFQAAAANADWDSVPGHGLMLIDEPGASSWPITAASYILMPIVAENGAAASAALKFFDWAYGHGGGLAQELDFVPMPENVVELARKAWARMADGSGKPIFARD
jgi:phosphate transport system substrate-binding protein